MEQRFDSIVIRVNGPKAWSQALILTKARLLGMLAGNGLEGIQAAGDQGALQRLLSLLDTADPGFAIVTP